MPLFYRVSATDWLEEAKDIPESWTGADTVKLAGLLAEKGVDVLDVSSGGNHPQQHPHVKPAYQAPFAVEVKKAVGAKMAVGTVGMVENARLANELLEKEGLDYVTVGRGFQKNPGLVFSWADELGVHVQMPNQVSFVSCFLGRVRVLTVDFVDPLGLWRPWQQGFREACYRFRFPAAAQLI